MNLVPTLLIPGLIANARLYQHQIPALWRFGPVTVANHTNQDSVESLAKSILADAPPRFALAGLSMGGYIALEILRQAPERVAKLALLDTSARADTPEQAEARRGRIAMAQRGEFAAIPSLMFPALVHASRREDAGLKALVEAMAAECGADAFMRQQTANMNRPDARPGLFAIACPTLVIVGEGDELTPPALAQEIAQGIPGARLEIVPDCGHLSTIERPEYVTGKLEELLERS
jgi:pimeloyl-ACP methyl ester carboxylesterase